MDNLRWLVCAGFLMSAMVDTVTGMGALSSLSMVYKACVCLGACFTLGPVSLRILVGVSAAFLLAVLHTAMFNELVSLDLIWVMRNLVLLVATLFFLEVFQTAERTAWERRIVLLCVVAFAVFTANVVLGLLGVGQAQYASGTGYTAGGKGFINAGNEMVTAMLAISAILIIAISKSSVQMRVAVYAALTIVLVVSGTKSGILGLFTLIGLQEGAGSRISTAQRALMGVMLVFAAWFGYDTLVNSFAGHRFFWFYETEGLTRALLSNRDYWASLTLEAFFNTGPLDFLLGSGNALIESATGGKPIVEMDVVDFLVSYGVLGLCAGYMAFALATRRMLANHKGEWLAPLSMIGLFFVLSAVSGHVLNGGTSAPYLGAMLAMVAAGHTRTEPVPRRRKAGRRPPGLQPARRQASNERPRASAAVVGKPVFKSAPWPASGPVTRPVLRAQTEKTFIQAFIVDESLDTDNGRVDGNVHSPMTKPAAAKVDDGSHAPAIEPAAAWDEQLPPPPTSHWSAQH